MPRRPTRSAAFPSADVAGLPARRAALRLLDAVLRRGDPLELALHAAAQGLAGPDRALAHAIAADTLRHLTDIDRMIDSVTAQPLPDDAKARMVLRLSLTQMLIMGTPAHAVIATSLPLIEGGPRRLVHGVLGTLSRAGTTMPKPPALPDAVAERWTSQWGEATCEAARTALGTRAPIDLTLANAAETESWVSRLGGVSLAPGHVRVSHDVSVPQLPGFAEGAWWVQDIAASIPARLAGAGEDRIAIDLCAAPGGKTMQLAAAGWQVTALDQSARRTERLHENLVRANLTAQVSQGDARTWRPETPASLVLLDAPCTATGIFRRHPDVLHRVGARQIAEMTELQTALLDNAAFMVAPGGWLIYATCSLERAEGEDQIAQFLASHSEFAVAPVDSTLLPVGVVAGSNGMIRVIPGTLADRGGADGFFIAALQRT